MCRAWAFIALLCTTSVLLEIRFSRAAVPDETLQLASRLTLSAAPGNSVIRIVADHMLTEWATTVRDRTFLELCSGCGETSKQFRLAGYATMEMDKFTRHATEDLGTVGGLLHAARSGARLREGGCALAGIPCQTFVFMSRSFARVAASS